jgi:teichuronic acid biosynthesis glycosyltransferase TuaG
MLNSQAVHPVEDFVSVIVPAFNAGSTIAASVKSVLMQEHRELEVLVADDGSVDATAQEVCHLAGSDSRVRLLRTAGCLGPAGARNAAISAASPGRWLAFLDSDDLWHPSKLSRQIALARESGAPLVYSAYWRISEDGMRCGTPTLVPTAVSYRQFLGNSAIATSTVLLDRERFGAPRLDGSVGYDDYELWSRLLAEGVIARGVTEPLMAYRVRLGSVSRRRVAMSREVWRVLRHRRGLPIPIAAYHFTSYALRAALKHRAGRPIHPSETTLPEEMLELIRP